MTYEVWTRAMDGTHKMHEAGTKEDAEKWLVHQGVHNESGRWYDNFGQTYSINKKANEVAGERVAGEMTWDYFFEAATFHKYIGKELGYKVDMEDYGDLAFAKGEYSKFYDATKDLLKFVRNSLEFLGIHAYERGAYITDLTLLAIADRAEEKGGEDFLALARAFRKVAAEEA